MAGDARPELSWLSGAVAATKVPLPTYYEHGALATNVQLVERLVRLIREMGYEPATPEEARQIIGLRPLR